jgi:hypothetical protein
VAITLGKRLKRQWKKRGILKVRACDEFNSKDQASLYMIASKFARLKVIQAPIGPYLNV